MAQKHEIQIAAPSCSRLFSFMLTCSTHVSGNYPLGASQAADVRFDRGIAEEHANISRPRAPAWQKGERVKPKLSHAVSKKAGSLETGPAFLLSYLVPPGPFLPCPGALMQKGGGTTGYCRCGFSVHQVKALVLTKCSCWFRGRGGQCGKPLLCAPLWIWQSMAPERLVECFPPDPLMPGLAAVLRVARGTSPWWQLHMCATE